MKAGTIFYWQSIRHWTCLQRNEHLYTLLKETDVLSVFYFSPSPILRSFLNIFWTLQSHMIRGHNDISTHENYLPRFQSSMGQKACFEKLVINYYCRSQISGFVLNGVIVAENYWVFITK